MPTPRLPMMSVPVRPRAPMVLPSDILRQITSHSVSPDTPPAAAPQLDWHSILGHPSDRWAALFCRHHRLPMTHTATPCSQCSSHKLLTTVSWTLPKSFAGYNTGPFRLLRCDLLRLFPGEKFKTRNYVLIIQDIYSSYVALRFLYTPGAATSALQSFLRFHARQRCSQPAILFTSTPLCFRPACHRTTLVRRAPTMQPDNVALRIRLLHQDCGLPLADWPFACKF